MMMRLRSRSPTHDAIGGGIRLTHDPLQLLLLFERELRCRAGSFAVDEPLGTFSLKRAPSLAASGGPLLQSLRQLHGSSRRAPLQATITAAPAQHSLTASPKASTRPHSSPGAMVPLHPWPPRNHSPLATHRMQFKGRGYLSGEKTLELDYSITSSARASSVGGISSPRVLAVVRLIMRSNLVGCSIGMSAGFAPRRILSTYSAVRRNSAGQFTP